ncbi:hypothetical protein GCM10010519_18380 [Streptomyces lactacystinicus]|uniref:hypothetical protein n=1 Tax=unclassified Kitasatospora TaxID=2633591 RepID=UPI00337C6F2E
MDCGSAVVHTHPIAQHRIGALPLAACAALHQVEEIGSTAEQLLACRRYALTDDARAVERF